MIDDPHITVSFTGHRSYGGAADGRLRTLIPALYARGFRRFLNGMAVGFDLAAAEAVLACRSECPGLRLVAVVPFEGQERRFSAADRERYARILAAADETIVLSPIFHRGCYALRNDFLVDHASLLIAWYDGTAGGTRYTVDRASHRSRPIVHLHPAAPVEAVQSELF